MNVHVNAFASDVKYVQTKAFPLGLKKIKR